MSSCNKMNYRNNFYNSWSNIPYPGEERVYHGIDPNAGSWSLVYFKKMEKVILLTLMEKKLLLMLLILHIIILNYNL